MTREIQLWASLWKWVYILGGSAFVLLAIYTVVVGARNIVQLFRDLGQAEDSQES